MPARLLHAGLDRVHWAIHDGSNLLIGTVVIVARLHHRPLFGPESGEGRGDCACALLAYQALLEGAATGAGGRVGGRAGDCRAAEARTSSALYLAIPKIQVETRPMHW